MQVDDLNKAQLLALADFIIGLERQVRLDPDEQQAQLLGTMVTETLLLDSEKRFELLEEVVGEMRTEIDLELAVKHYEEEMLEEE